MHVLGRHCLTMVVGKGKGNLQQEFKLAEVFHSLESFWDNSVGHIPVSHVLTLEVLLHPLEGGESIVRGKIIHQWVYLINVLLVMKVIFII